ncbi:SDR family NAD(P)-dependent oxidoreductase [Sandarakinorhabdus sp.]|uniref:SDR family NAD(P)-dependent oxidoreductase n=1 Tax=Sandarakinorhabdus sp. TaxID=1916663 RepID=UPI00286E69C9|nr:SDR family NAD(P)-dependent oxidoreductase [Sandarakinorhabdus sp.]
MPSALIIGASRGIGLGLTQEFISRGWDVVATQRSASLALAATGAQVATVDIDDADTVSALATSLAGKNFDHVLINAGITGGRADTASTVSRDAMAQLFWTNAIAPIRAGRILLPLVKDGGSIGFMSSILGSVGGRQNAWAELYSASKAALNSLTRGFAVQDIGSRDVAVLTLHPGWVKTDMGGPDADIDVATSVKGLAGVITDSIASARARGQRYVDYSGAAITW